MSATDDARRARESYALTKAIVLEDVADGKREAVDAIATLEKQFTTAAIRFFRKHSTSHGRVVWASSGPITEIDEVLRAYASPAAWSALLERVRKAREERTRVL